MKKTLVFIINSRYPYYSGGRETWLHNITEILIKHYNIIIVNYKNQNNSSHFDSINESINFIKVSTLGNKPVIGKFMRYYLSFVDNLYGTWKMYNELRKLEMKIKPIAYISLDTIYSSMPIIHLKKTFPEICFVCNVKGLHAEDLSTKLTLLKKYFYKQESTSLKIADKIWTNGYDTTNYVEKLGFNSEMIGNGINLSYIDECSKKPVDSVYDRESIRICSVGTLRDIKGIKELIEAGNILKEMGVSNFEIIFVGKGNPSKYIEYARSKGIVSKVHFVGEKKDVVPYLKESDIIACLSGGGGMSMAALESMASKTPVIAWDSKIYTQIITHDETGYLVNAWDSKKLAEGLHHVIHNLEEYRKKGIKARESVVKYDWVNIANKIIKQLDSETHE